MARYFNIKLTGGTSSGPYSIYYDTVSAGSLAILFPSGLPASGVTLADLTSPLGVGIQVPDNALTIILFNNKCDTYQTFDIGPNTEDIICFCLTVIPIAGQPDEVINQVLFCPTGLYINGHPVYEGAFNGEVYSLTWSDLKKYWEVNGLPFINGPIRSYDSSNLPLTGWEVFGECSNDYMVIADEGECPDPLTIYFINCEQTNPTCLGINNGSIISHAIGGSGSWEYSKDGINYTDIGLFNELYAGSYTIYARDKGNFNNITSCSILLQAPASTTYPLVISVTTQDRFISTSSGFKYYQLDYQIDTSGLPNGVSITFDFVLDFILNYIQPGTAIFDTNSSVIKKNNNIIPLTLVSSQTPIQNGQSSCNSIYGNFDGHYKISATNITVTNSDVIDGYVVYGINTETNGQYIDSCLTKAKVTVVATLENAKTNTVCDSVSVVSLNYTRIQTYSGESIVTVINTTNQDGGNTGVGTTTTQSNSVCNYYCVSNNVSEPSTNQSFNYSMTNSQTFSTNVGGDSFDVFFGNVIYNNPILSSSNYSTSTGRYTASCRGIYQFTVSLKFALTVTNFTYTDINLTIDLNTYDQNGNLKTNIILDTVSATPTLTWWGPRTVSNIAMDIGDYVLIQLYYTVTDFAGANPSTLALMITDGVFGSNSQDIYLVNCRSNNDMVVAYTDCTGLQQNINLAANGTTIMIQSSNYSSISLFWADNRIPLPNFSNGDYTISGMPCSVTPTTTNNNTTPTTTHIPFKVWRLITCSQPYINDPNNQGALLCYCYQPSYIIVYTNLSVTDPTAPNTVLYTNNILTNKIPLNYFIAYQGSIYQTNVAGGLTLECTL